jgi:biofilm PGA synthesis N-glycosyltransferase PgaC
MWQFLFWASLGVVAYSYLGYPLLLFLLDKFRRRDRHTIDDTCMPPVCLVVSAFNEEKVIQKKIENSLALDYPSGSLTVLVASDGSNDATVSIAQQYAASGVTVLHRAARSGKSAVLNDVIRGIGDEIVVFTDANSFFAPDALKKLVRHFHDPAIGCVVGRLRYVDRHTSSVAKGEGIYWKYEGIISILESRQQRVLVANGSIFGIRRSLFMELCPEVANDFQLPIEIASRGYGVIYEPEAIAVEPTAVFWEEEFQRKVRIVLRGLSGFARLRDRVRGFQLWQFFSHKLIRWAAGPLLFVTLLSNAMLADDSAFYAVLLGLQLAFYAAAANGWRLRRARKPHAVFYVPFYFTMVNLAAVMAFSKFLSGDRQQYWEKAESSRFAVIAKPAEPVHRESATEAVVEEHTLQAASSTQKVARH